MRGNPTTQLLDEIACRFIANLPRQELSEQRIGFHFEKAYFYYLDVQDLPPISYNRGKNKTDKSKQIKQTVYFCNELLRVVSCPQLPRLTGSQISQLIQQNYCVIPVHGIIILNMEETYAVLVQSQDNDRYGFPKGKVNEGQSSDFCAIREVKQEIGINLQVDPNSYIQILVLAKMYPNKTLSKTCRFYLCKVDESCIISRQADKSPDKMVNKRQIIHSASQIRSIGWYKINGEIDRLIEKDLLNTPSKLAYFELTKRLTKNFGYKEKKVGNPLEDFKGFDKNLGQIFQR